MKFHLIQPGMIGRKHEIEQGMAGQNKELYQRYCRGEAVHQAGRRAGYASYGHNWETFFLPFGQGYANVMMGDVDEISRQIENAHNLLGFNEMWIQFGQGHLDVEENTEELYRFATEIAPRFSEKDAEGTWV